MGNTMSDKWFKIFRNFEGERIKRAKEANIPGFVTPDGGDHSNGFRRLTEIDHPWVRLLYDGPFYGSVSHSSVLPAVNLVFVQSKPKTGQPFGSSGVSNPGELGGGETDKHFIYEGASRAAANAVMAGANTVRREKPEDPSVGIFSVWHPEAVRLRLSYGQPRHPRQIVVTERGNLDIEGELMFNIPGLDAFVITTQSGAKRLRPQTKGRSVHIISTGRRLNIPHALRDLKEFFGIHSISVIGGRKLATTLIDQGLVHDLYLTTAPKELPGEYTPFYTGRRNFPRELIIRKLGRGREKGVVFEHFRLA